MTTYPTFADLLDAARPRSLWGAVARAVTQAATERYKSAHNGRYNARGIENEERLVEEKFLAMVNAWMEKDSTHLGELADTILFDQVFVATAWAVAQKLKEAK